MAPQGELGQERRGEVEAASKAQLFRDVGVERLGAVCTDLSQHVGLHGRDRIWDDRVDDGFGAVHRASRTNFRSVCTFGSWSEVPGTSEVGLRPLYFGGIAPRPECGPKRGRMSAMATRDRVRAGSEAAAAPAQRRPDWIRVRAPSGETVEWLRELMRSKSLHTVCEEAMCPNMGEGWGSGTATL